MTDPMQVPTRIKSAVLVNVVNDLILSISLFFFPEHFIAFSGWASFDPFALRLIAGGLSAVAIELFLIRNGSLEIYKSVLNIKVATIGIGLVGVTMALIQSPRQPLIAEWILFVGLLIPFIQLGYWRIQLGKLMAK